MQRNPSQQFIVQPCAELSIVVDSTSGRQVSRSLPQPEAVEYCNDLNVAVGHGSRALSRALCDEPEFGETDE
jgi:hypothetical protein